MKPTRPIVVTVTPGPIALEIEVREGERVEVAFAYTNDEIVPEARRAIEAIFKPETSGSALIRRIRDRK